jgi:type 1 glutamine amidotransferase
MTIYRPAYRCFVCLSLAIVLAFSSGWAAGQDPPTTHARVLLVTGEDYPGHVWKKTAPVLKAQLSKDPRLSVHMLTDLASLATTSLDEYDAVVLHFKNYDPKVPGRKAFDNLRQYVEQGGGLMLVHFACGAFEEFRDEFEKVAGRVWFGMKPPAGRSQHDPLGRFTVNIADPDHPITKGLGNFETTDELYTCLVGETPIKIIATAVSKLDGKTYPMAFVLRYGKGRIFHSVLGHHATALQAPGPAELHRRGCAWVANLAPVAPGETKPADQQLARSMSEKGCVIEDGPQPIHPASSLIQFRHIYVKPIDR